MRIELTTVPNAVLDVADDGTATLTVRYDVTDREAVRAQAVADSIVASDELLFKFVRIDPPDVCGMGDHVLMTQRYRRHVPLREALARIVRGHLEADALEAAGAAVEALTAPPVDPDPAA